MNVGDRVKVVRASNGIKQVYMDCVGTVVEVGTSRAYAHVIKVKLDKPKRGNTFVWFSAEELEVIS